MAGVFIGSNNYIVASQAEVSLLNSIEKKYLGILIDENKRDEITTPAHLKKVADFCSAVFNKNDSGLSISDKDAIRYFLLQHSTFDQEIKKDTNLSIRLLSVLLIFAHQPEPVDLLLDALPREK